MAFAQVQAKFKPNNQGTHNLSLNGSLYRMENNHGTYLLAMHYERLSCNNKHTEQHTTM